MVADTPTTRDAKVYRRIEIASSEDVEIDAIHFCIEAIKQVSDVNARSRVVEYLMDRFVTRVKDTP